MGSTEDQLNQVGALAGVVSAILGVVVAGIAAAPLFL